MLHLAPSILNADYANLGRELELITGAGADYIHLDVMDGSYVPSISFGIPLIKSLRGLSDAVFDVHLMMVKPERYVEEFAECGADIICVHAEASVHLDRTIQLIHSCGCKAAVALNPATPISVLDCVLDQLDMVLIMSVNPGFGGQTLIPYTLDKISALRKTARTRGLNLDIEIDGGVNTGNLLQIMEAGANVIVAGSTIFTGDREENVKNFIKIMKEYE